MYAASDDIEWDERKRALVLEKHGIDFVDAVAVFDLPHLVVRSDREGETRWRVIGVCNGVIIAVIVTKRGEALRLVTARRARRDERERYRAAIEGGAGADEGPDRLGTAAREDG